MMHESYGESLQHTLRQGNAKFPRTEMNTTKISECDCELVVARRDAFLTADVAKATSLASTFSTLPSARLEWERLRNAVSRKDLTAALDNLPPLTAVEVRPQTWFPSEHAYKVRIGSSDNCPVWVALGECKSAVEHGPNMMFYEGHTDSSLVSGGLFHNLGRIAMVEPFATFWHKSAAPFENNKDVAVPRGRWDERRGQFKSLVYWYLASEAAERDGECRVPNTVSKYLVSALKVLGRTVVGTEQMTGNVDTRKGIRVKDGFAAQSRLAECAKEQRELEEAREEEKERETEEMRQTAGAKSRQEEDQTFSISGGRLQDVGDTNKPTARIGKIDSTQDDYTTTSHSPKRKRTIESTDIASNDNTSATEIYSSHSESYKAARYSPYLHADVCNPDNDTTTTTTTETKANLYLFLSTSIQATDQSHMSAFKRAIKRHEELEENEKRLQHKADELEKKSVEVQQQLAVIKKLKEDNLWVIKDLAIEW